MYNTRKNKNQSVSSEVSSPITDSVFDLTSNAIDIETSTAAINDQLITIGGIIPDKVDPVFASMTTAIQMILSTLQDLTKTLQRTQGQLIEEGKVQTQKIDTLIGEINSVKEENKALREANKDLCYKVNDLEQYSKNYNLVLQGVPVVQGENLYHVVSDIARIVGCNINPDSIELCHRLRKRDRAAGNQPPEIVAKFFSRQVKENILEGRKNKKVLLAHEVGFQNSNNKVYINEHLTTTNKHLFWLARKVKETGYKYVWTRSGKVFVRKDEQSQVIRVASASDIPT
jgi:hypothetical protein